MNPIVLPILQKIIKNLKIKEVDLAYISEPISVPISEHLANFLQSKNTPKIEIGPAYDSGGLGIILGTDGEGLLTILHPFRWDLCSPRFGIFWKNKKQLINFGTPNRGTKNEKLRTIRASLVHDALCRFRKEIANILKISEEEWLKWADMEFRFWMDQDWKQMSKPYYWGIGRLGKFWRSWF